MTATTPKLPDHNGEPVHKSQMKFTGVGTGFTGLDVAPIFMDLDEVGYFVMKASATESPSARRDNNENLFWLNRLGVESVAPIDQETAEKALQQYAQQIEERKAALEGQEQLFAEQEAEEREQADETDSPADIAQAAKNRAKNQP